MRPFDFTQWEPLFNAVSGLRTCLLLCDLHGIEPLFGPFYGTGRNLKSIQADVVNTYDRLRGWPFIHHLGGQS